MSVLIAILIGVLGLPQAAPKDRLTDEQTKELFDRLDSERDRFEDELDGDLKDSIIKGPGGEVKVARYLDDLQENVDKVKGRFKSSYGAGAEVSTLLKQGSTIHRFMSSQPPNFEGASEWNRLASSLTELAAVYGTGFPLEEGAPVRRIQDAEVASAATQVAEAADRFKSALDSALKQKAVPDADRHAAVDEVEGLKRDAKTLSSRVKDGKPASGEAAQVLQRAQRIQEAATALQVNPATQQALQGILKPLDTIAQGFGLPTVKPRTIS